MGPSGIGIRVHELYPSYKQVTSPFVCIGRPYWGILKIQFCEKLKGAVRQTRKGKHIW